jgi:hypothetical protein
MVDFKPIFDTHFFSNHHLQAQALEAQLEDRFPGCQCVTFASLESLLLVVAGELCSASVELLNVSSRNNVQQSIAALSGFLHATGRPAINTPPSDRRAALATFPGNRWPVDASLVSEGEVVAYLVDASGLQPMLAGAGLFITPDAALSEKIRWARSSYGRRSSSSVRVFANGRFSEFQAMLLADGLASGSPSAT